MAAYDIGDEVRCSVEFMDSTGTFADPSTVTFKLKNPSGTVTTYVYGTDAQLEKSAVGRYYVDVTINATGIWSYRFEGTGLVNVASESKFTIKQSVF